MRQFREPIQRQDRSISFQRMSDAKQRIHARDVVGMVLEREDLGFQTIELVLRIGEEQPHQCGAVNVHGLAGLHRKLHGKLESNPLNSGRQPSDTRAGPVNPSRDMGSIAESLNEAVLLALANVDPGDKAPDT